MDRVVDFAAVRGRDELESILRRIDRRGYKAYKDIRGSYAFGDLELHVDHVQGDPFAAPSKLRVRIPQAHAALPRELCGDPVRRLGFESFLARRLRRALPAGARRGSGKSGLIAKNTG